MSVTSKKEDGTEFTLLTLDLETDIREALFYAYAQAEMPIYSMNMTRASLEEVFLELTETGKMVQKEKAEKGIKRLLGKRKQKETEGFGPVVSEAEAETGGVAREELLHREEVRR